MRVRSIQALHLLFACITICSWDATGWPVEKFVKHVFNYYTASVFENAPIEVPGNGNVALKKNLNKYRLAAETAAKYDTDIIVFPEEGLFAYNYSDPTWFLKFAENIPDPRLVQTNPCDQKNKFQNRPILRHISCLAKNNGIYVVVALLDVKKCEVKKKCNEYNIDYCTTNSSNCPESGVFNFNTQVVFDRKGFLITRYHKRHPYFEDGITAAKDPRTVYFDTDFGRFALDICFDLLFEDTVEGLKKSNASNVAFSTWWIDHTPFVYFSTSYQQAWSMTNKVNFLAANVQYQPAGSLGCGIYTPKSGALIYTENPDNRSKLLISNVPKSPAKDTGHMKHLNQKFFYIDGDSVSELKGEEPRSFRKECGINVLGNEIPRTDYRCSQTDVHQYNFIKLTKKDGTIYNCSNGFCCSLTYKANSMNEDFYFGVSGNPLNFYGAYSFGVQACFLARCESLDGLPCRNYLLKSNTIFQEVKIKGNFSTKQIYPFAVNNDVRLTDRSYWHFDGISTMQYKNSKLDSALIFLGLYGRKYKEDKST